MKRQAFSLFTLIFILLAACQPASPDAQQISPSPTEVGDSSVDLIPASTDDIQIITTNIYRDAFGVWRVVGLLANQSDQFVGAIALNIEYLGQSGEVLAQETDYSVAASIAPGETVPFWSSPSEDLSAVGEVNINVAEVYLIEAVAVQLDVVNVQMQVRRDGIVQVTGEILNASSDTVMLERIGAAVFSSEGQPLMANESDAGPRMLSPGEQAPFRVLLFGNQQASGSMEHQLYISAIKSEEAPSFEIAFLEGEYTYVDQFGQFHIVGELQNSGEVSLDIQLLCGLYNADGEVIDVISYNVMPSSLGPGEIAPFDIVFRSDDPDVPIAASSVIWTHQIDRFITRFVDHPSVELSTTDATINIAGTWALFSGYVINDTAEPIEMILVIAGFREETTGELVAIGSQLIFEDLLTGESTNYRLIVTYDPALDPDALEEFVLARAR